MSSSPKGAVLQNSNVEVPVVPTLVRGSQYRGYGVGCIMQLTNWLREGDRVGRSVSDHNPDFFPSINSMLIGLNDLFCANTTNFVVQGREFEKLCPKCTMYLLDLADKFNGTAYLVSDNSIRTELDSLAGGVVADLHVLSQMCSYGTSKNSAPAEFLRLQIRAKVARMISLVEFAKEGETPLPSVRTVKATKFMEGEQYPIQWDEILPSTIEQMEKMKYGFIEIGNYAKKSSDALGVCVGSWGSTAVVKI